MTSDTNRPSEAAIREPAENYIEWWGTSTAQHRERMRACVDRRKAYPDDECADDGSCSECMMDMAEALETPASKARRAGTEEGMNP